MGALAFKPLNPKVKIWILICCLYLNDMEIPETKRFIPKGFELGTTLS